MNILRFNIDRAQKEAIVINEQLVDIVLYENINIVFCGASQYELAQDCFDYIIEGFKITLHKALNGELKLHSSLYDNAQNSLLGYQWCKYLQKEERKDLIYDRANKGIQWIGYQYTLFETSHGANTPASWLYNDEQGSIVFELTPVYPWFSSRPQPGEPFLKYSEWMKAYAPFLTRIIAKETAEQWLKQIDELIEVVKKNDERLRCTGIGCVHCAHIGKTGCPCGSLVLEEKKDCC